MIVETSYHKQEIKYLSICTSVHVEDEEWKRAPKDLEPCNPLGGSEELFTKTTDWYMMKVSTNCAFAWKNKT